MLDYLQKMPRNNVFNFSKVFSNNSWFFILFFSRSKHGVTGIGRESGACDKKAKNPRNWIRFRFKSVAKSNWAGTENVSNIQKSFRFVFTRIFGSPSNFSIVHYIAENSRWRLPRLLGALQAELAGVKLRAANEWESLLLMWSKINMCFDWISIKKCQNFPSKSYYWCYTWMTAFVKYLMCKYESLAVVRGLLLSHDAIQ